LLKQKQSIKQIVETKRQEINQNSDAFLELTRKLSIEIDASKKLIIDGQLDKIKISTKLIKQVLNKEETKMRQVSAQMNQILINLPNSLHDSVPTTDTVIRK
jgi:seryl-tRNA synthetase